MLIICKSISEYRIISFWPSRYGQFTSTTILLHIFLNLRTLDSACYLFFWTRLLFIFCLGLLLRILFSLKAGKHSWYSHNPQHHSYSSQKRSTSVSLTQYWYPYLPASCQCTWSSISHSYGQLAFLGLVIVWEFTRNRLEAIRWRGSYGWCSSWNCNENTPLPIWPDYTYSPRTPNTASTYTQPGRHFVWYRVIQAKSSQLTL